MIYKKIYFLIYILFCCIRIDEIHERHILRTVIVLTVYRSHELKLPLLFAKMILKLSSHKNGCREIILDCP